MMAAHSLTSLHGNASYIVRIICARLACIAAAVVHIFGSPKSCATRTMSQPEVLHFAGTTHRKM